MTVSFPVTGQSAVFDNNITSSPETKAAELLSNCTRLIADCVQQAGVRPARIQLRQDLDGTIQVVHFHEALNAIERAVNSDEKIMTAFTKTRVAHEALHIANKHSPNDVFNLGLTSAGGLVFFTKA
jgi:hypothetical protein